MTFRLDNNSNEAHQQLVNNPKNQWVTESLLEKWGGNKNSARMFLSQYKATSED